MIPSRVVLLLASAVLCSGQTKIFDASGQAAIQSIKVHVGGDIVIGGATYGPALPRVNAFQNVFQSSGVFRTRDGGHTWQPVQHPIPNPFQLDTSMIVHPWDPDLVYAVSEQIVFRSTDGAETWEKIAGPLTDINLWGNGSARVVQDWQQPATTYIYHSYIGAFRSVDSGSHWSRLRLPSAVASANVPTLTVDPLRAGHGIREPVHRPVPEQGFGRSVVTCHVAGWSFQTCSAAL